MSGANLQLWGINRHERGGKSLALARRALAADWQSLGWTT